MATRSATLYQGEDMTPTLDYTDYVVWEESEFGTRAWQGEINGSSIVIRDPLGEQGNAADLPTGLTFRPLSSKNLFVVKVGSDFLFRGRVGIKSYSRDGQQIERYRQVEVQLHDTNWDLDHIFVHNWTRGEESDKARTQGLIASYLSASPRPTTALNGSNYISSSNTVTLPAHTYTQSSPLTILREISQSANKQFFVTGDAVTGGSLFYDGNDSTAYACTLSISDRASEVNHTTVFAPIWNVGPASTEDGSEQLDEVILFYGTAAEQYVRVHDDTIHTQYGHASGTFTDSTATTATEALRRANGIISHRKLEDRTYNVTIGPLTDAQVVLVKHGQTISIKARAIPDADDQSRTMRIVQCRYTTPIMGTWFVHLQLGRPWKLEPYGSGPTLVPQPPTPCTDPVGTPVETWDFTTGTDPTVAHPECEGTFGPGVPVWGDGTGLVPEYGINATPLNADTGSDAFSVTAGNSFGISASFLPYNEYVYLQIVWVDNSCAVLSSSLIATGFVGWFDLRQGPTTFSGSVTAPTGATAAYLQAFASNAAGDKLSAYTGWATEASVTDNGDPDSGDNCDEPNEIVGPGEGSLGDDDGTYANVGHTHEHGDQSGDVAVEHDAAQVIIADDGGYFTGSTVEAALQEIGPGITLQDVEAQHRYILCAHRGDINPDDGYPENTLEAVRQAVMRGAHEVELDVQQTSDGVWMLLHDETLTRTTNLTDDINDVTAATVEAGHIDGGYGYNAGRHGTSLTVPRLLDVLDAIRPYDCVVNFDLKDPVAASNTALAEFIIANWYVERSIINTKSLTQAAAIKAVDARLVVMAQTGVTSSPQTEDDVDIWLAERTEVTSMSDVTSRAPDRVDLFFDVTTDYGDDESTWISDAFDYGVRAILTNDLPAAQTALVTYLGLGGGVTALDDLSDVTITSAAEHDTLLHNGTAFVNTPLDQAGHWEVLMAEGAVDPPDPLETGDGLDWLYVWVI